MPHSNLRTLAASRDLCITLLVVIAWLAVIEIGLRLSGARISGSLFTAHPTRDFAFRPGAHAWHTEEGESYIRINSYGYRDDEYSIAKPLDTLRIAVVGDSSVAGREVDFSSTLPQVLRRELEARRGAGHRVEVMNFGVPDYGLAHQLLVIREDVLRFHPDLVVVALSQRNDVFNSNRATKVSAASFPSFELRGGELVADYETLHHPAFNPARTARNNRWLDFENDWCRLCLVVSLARSEAAGLIHDQIDNRPQIEWLFRDHANPQTDKAWDVTEALLKQMLEECRAKNVEFWTVILDMPEQTISNPAARSTTLTAIGAANPYYPDKRLETISRNLHIPCLDTVPFLAGYTARTGVSVHGFPNSGADRGHLNEKGYALIGHLLADALWSGSEAVHRHESDSSTENPAIGGGESAPRRPRQQF